MNARDVSLPHLWGPSMSLRYCCPPKNLWIIHLCRGYGLLTSVQAMDIQGMPLKCAVWMQKKIICSACRGGDTPEGNDIIMCDFAGCRRCFHQALPLP